MMRISDCGVVLGSSFTSNRSSSSCIEVEYALTRVGVTYEARSCGRAAGRRQNNRRAGRCATTSRYPRSAASSASRFPCRACHAPDARFLRPPLEPRLQARPCERGHAGPHGRIERRRRPRLICAEEPVDAALGTGTAETHRDIPWWPTARLPSRTDRLARRTLYRHLTPRVGLQGTPHRQRRRSPATGFRAPRYAIVTFMEPARCSPVRAPPRPPMFARRPSRARPLRSSPRLPRCPCRCSNRGKPRRRP